MLWLRLDVKVGFCVWRLAFGVWRLPQRGVEHETKNPRADKMNKKESRKRSPQLFDALPRAEYDYLKMMKGKSLKNEIN